MASSNWSNLRKALGPGILMAGAAIGGSHLVASTRAGAEYGFALIGILLLANLFKYPFILYGTRYTAATGQSLLLGYYQYHPGYLYVFVLVTLFTGVINIVAVALVAASLATNFRVTAELPLLTSLVLLFCGGLIILGHYRLLDRVSKVVVGALAATTLVAVGIALADGPSAAPDFVSPSPWTMAAFAGLIVFMGWMPAPIDVSVWPSLWMGSRSRETGHRASMREAMIDFNLGYGITVLLALAFLLLGAYVMHGTGADFSSRGTEFAGQLIGLFTAKVGDWSHWIIAIAAFTAMFSTTLTCVDAYPRGIAVAQQIICGGDQGERRLRRLHLIWILLHLAVGLLMVWWLVASLGTYLDFAMTISFLAAPVLAWMNHRVIRAAEVPVAYRPRGLLSVLDWAGLVFLVSFSLFFIGWRVLG